MGFCNISSKKKSILLIFLLLLILSFISACEKKSNQLTEMFNNIKKENNIYYPKNKDELKLLVKISNLGLDEINVKEITDMSELFKGSKRKSFKGIETWDTSNVKNMAGMFKGAVKFNQDISKWNVSHVENMENMFNGAKLFNADISKWNISKVENFKNIFEGAESFNQDLSSWKVPFFSKKYIEKYVK